MPEYPAHDLIREFLNGQGIPSSALGKKGLADILGEFDQLQFRLFNNLSTIASIAAIVAEEGDAEKVLVIIKRILQQFKQGGK